MPDSEINLQPQPSWRVAGLIALASVIVIVPLLIFVLPGVGKIVFSPLGPAETMIAGTYYKLAVVENAGTTELIATNLQDDEPNVLLGASPAEIQTKNIAYASFTLRGRNYLVIRQVKPDLQSGGYYYSIYEVFSDRIGLAQDTKGNLLNDLLLHSCLQPSLKNTKFVTFGAPRCDVVGNSLLADLMGIRVVEEWELVE